MKTWETLQPLIHLKPGDEGYHECNVEIEGVTLVRTKKEAERVLGILQSCDYESVFHACDTEVMAIDLKEVGPVGNGYVTCLSIYSGPDIDYGNGPNLWIDNLDDACGILQMFKPWLQDERHLKVWHNYGFDRHVLWNEGINVQGFGGDTMHMARLQDTSRAKMGRGYSLEALTDALLKRRKQPMKELFGIKRKRKDGTDGLLVDIPAVEVLQRDPLHRTSWIQYSCYDAEGTWLLREELQTRLERLPWCRGKTLYDYYQMYMRPFGQVLTDMERRGIHVNARDYLANVEVQARADRAAHLHTFRTWAASKIGPDGLALNPASSVQLTTFLFGGALNDKTKVPTEAVRVVKVARDEITDEAMEAYQQKENAQTPQTGSCMLLY
jgi:DNA polymerase-1